MKLKYDPDIFDAVEFGDIDSVKMYFTEDIDINYQELNGRDMTMIASYYGHAEILKYLLQYNPDLTQKDKEGKTAIEIAKEKNHTKIIKILESYHEKLQKPLD